jgi:hypothetical protein
MHNAPIKQVGDAITLSRDITVSNDELKLYCYPNPNNGNFNLVFSKTISSGSVEILTSNGIKILSKKIQNSLSNLNFEGENLEPGMYFIHYRGEGIDKNIKFIVVQ